MSDLGNFGPLLQAMTDPAAQAMLARFPERCTRSGAFEDGSCCSLIVQGVRGKIAVPGEIVIRGPCGVCEWRMQTAVVQVTLRRMIADRRVKQTLQASLVPCLDCGRATARNGYSVSCCAAVWLELEGKWPRSELLCDTCQDAVRAAMTLVLLEKAHDV